MVFSPFEVCISIFFESTEMIMVSHSAVGTINLSSFSFLSVEIIHSFLSRD